MNERDDILIDRYLAHEASDEEIHEVEERGKTDPEFRQKLIDAEQAISALRAYQQAVIRDRLSARNNMRDRGSDKDPPGNNNSTWVWLLGILGLGVLIWFFIPAKEPTAAPARENLQDTIEVHASPHFDSSKALQENRIHTDQQDVDVQQDEKSPGLAQHEQEKHIELFAMHFTPYVDEMMDPAVRGEGEVSPLEKFQLAYWEQRYTDALKEFPNISPAMQRNDNVRFMQANALMTAGRVLEARDLLQSILLNGKSRYLLETHWYLGLCELRSRREKEAEEQLRIYLKDARARKKQDAEMILRELGDS